MMRDINNYIVNKDCLGVLLCKDKTVKFYSDVDWLKVVNNKVSSEFSLADINLMVYHVANVNNLKIIGKSF